MLFSVLKYMEYNIFFNPENHILIEVLRLCRNYSSDLISTILSRSQRISLRVNVGKRETILDFVSWMKSTDRSLEISFSGKIDDPDRWLL